ncbi:hypothetical protein [Streptomyces sp. NPDC059893]|uniref:hypothetical protein n=1 Tax=Streptomyces sp. NPDC059893 TaxID=3346990 RepID=UPI003648FBD6
MLGAAGGEHQGEGQVTGRGERVREVLGVFCGGVGGADQQPRKRGTLVFVGVLVVFQEQFAEVPLRGAQVRYGAQAALGESGGQFGAEADGEDVGAIAPGAGGGFQREGAGCVAYGVAFAVRE